MLDHEACNLIIGGMAVAITSLSVALKMVWSRLNKVEDRATEFAQRLVEREKAIQSVIGK